VIPAFWSAPLPAYLWQVALHSWVMGLVFYIWAHRVDLPSGRTKRRLLVLLLLVPMVTAAVPGRSAVEFGERVAWLNSARILAVPLIGGFHISHLILLIAAMMAALTIWQEVLPLRGRPRATGADVPESLLALVRAHADWANCRVALSPADAIVLATGGLPGRPSLIVSQGALDQLTPTELEIAIAHEHAHWQAGRWLRSHLLFAVRLLQCYNPVALWVFREYCIEVEIGCDAVAVTGRDPHLLARILLKIYQSTDRHDVAALGALRKRVDVLLAGGPQDAALPTATIAAVAVFMLVVLPWIV
jgi:hypothetical protein